MRLVAIASLRGVPISKMLAQDAMKNIIDSERPEGLTMERIARTVASHYKLTVEEMKSKNNSRAIAVPRQVAMYLCKTADKTQLSRDRPRVRRQASHDRDALVREDRRPRNRRSQFPQGRERAN